MPPLRRGTNLTMKEQGFIGDFIKGKQIRKAIKNNYNVKNGYNASVLGNAMLKKPRIQYAILDMMDRVGISDLRLVEKMKSLIFDGRKEVLDREGKVVQLEDPHIQIKALDMAMKIKGAYAPERHESVGFNVNIYSELSDEELNNRLRLIESREANLVEGAGEEAGSA